MTRRNLALVIVVLVILTVGAGYYFWNKKGASNTPSTSNQGAVSQEGSSFLDTFFEKLKLSNKPQQPGFKEYKDAAGTFSIQYPFSWVTHSEKGRLLSGASLTPPELLNQYSEEERQFVKGLVFAAAESDKSPQDYYNDLSVGIETGQTEAKNLTINGYPAYMAKGVIKGVSYTIYIISHNNHIVYFNYRTKEDESAHQNDIQKAIDFAPYILDFEAAVNSIRFLK